MLVTEYSGLEADTMPANALNLKIARASACMVLPVNDRQYLLSLQS